MVLERRNGYHDDDEEDEIKTTASLFQAIHANFVLVQRATTAPTSSVLVHCVQKKTPIYVFDYNSCGSWSIFILFVPVEREMNTLQFTYSLDDVIIASPCTPQKFIS